VQNGRQAGRKMVVSKYRVADGQAGRKMEGCEYREAGRQTHRWKFGLQIGRYTRNQLDRHV
jgi:hypothetical protein